MDWKKLKDFCNSLPESELEKKVILWREEEAITDISASQLDSDMYIEIYNNEDGCFEMFEVEEMIKNYPEDYPEGMDHFKKVYDKGHPILSENF